MHKEPASGSQPTAFPAFSMPRFFHTSAYAPSVPVRALRPIAYSAESPTKLNKATKQRYAIKNAPPPFAAILYGKPHTFAIPTAEPTHASINPHFVLNCFDILTP